jgi:DNA-binding transcriptional regulator WhiA
MAYLTFDGHLYKDLSAFFLSSRRIKNLKEFERIIKRKFGMNGKYKLNSGGIKNNTHKFIIFNKKISKELHKLGVPKGDKVIQNFNIPTWVSSSKEFSKEYLEIAFLCEGCNKDEKGRTPRIQINIAKTEDIIDSGLRFMNNLRKMLKNLGINTTKCYITGKRSRKTDGKISKDIKFRIDIKDNHKFIKQIAPFFKWG